MTKPEAIKILKTFNKWRKGGTKPLKITPKEIGEAIDFAITELKKM